MQHDSCILPSNIKKNGINTTTPIQIAKYWALARLSIVVVPDDWG